MNYYREKYYEYLKVKNMLKLSLDVCENSNVKGYFSFQKLAAVADIQRALAVIQLKLEYADDLATKHGMKEFKLKNHLKLTA